MHSPIRYVLVALLLCGCNLFEPTAPVEHDGRDMAADADVAPAVDMEQRDAPCVPDSDLEICAALMFGCDSHEVVDNCGATRTVVCGACAADEVCDAGVCNCVPEDAARFCDRQTATCGAVTAADNCGTTRTEDCGVCDAPAECGGGGTANVCACPSETDVEFCAANAAQCGVVTAIDTCGAERTVDCGQCAAPETCGGNGTAHECGCAAESDQVFCPRVGAECGPVTAEDNCGLSRTTSCGGCPAGEMCSANVCVCAPESDQDFCARVLSCGPVSDFDNCGALRTVDCPATCASGEQCVNDRCTCAPQDDVDFCASHGRVCGSYTAADNCAMQRTAICGTCGGTDVCTNGLCEPAFPPADLSTWLRTDQGILLAMQNDVESWTDQANGDVWSAPTKQSQPTLFTGAQGIDGLRFYGGQYFLAPATLSSDAFTAVFVAQRLDTDREGPLAGSSNAIGSANEIAFGSTNTTIRVESASAGVSFSATVLPTTELTVITIRAGAGTFEFFQGDTLTASAPITGTGAFMFDQIGSFQSLRGLRGDLYEVMAWPRRLTDAERAVVTSTLETKFGL